MHPDLKKALELVTKHAGAAHAGKMFAHLSQTPSMPTPEKALNEGTQSDVLEHDVNTHLPENAPPGSPGMSTMLLEPDGDEDIHGHDMGNEGGERDPEMHIMGVARTGPAPRIMESHEMPKRGRGRPRKAK